MAVYKEGNRQGAPDIKSYVYNALADVAFEMSMNGIDVTAEEFDDAVRNFMNRFFDNTEVYY